MPHLTYTIHETGTRLVISPGEWNSPPDGYRSRPAYWTPVPAGEAAQLDLRLRAGEWDRVPAAMVPDALRDQADHAYAQADYAARPWTRTATHATGGAR